MIILRQLESEIEVVVDRRLIWSENYLLSDVDVFGLLVLVLCKADVTFVKNRGFHQHLGSWLHWVGRSIKLFIFLMDKLFFSFAWRSAR